MRSEPTLRLLAGFGLAVLLAPGGLFAQAVDHVIEMELDGTGGITLDPGFPPVIQCKKINPQGYCVGGKKDKICWQVADEDWAAKIAGGDTVLIRAKEDPDGPAARGNEGIFDENKPGKGTRGQFVIDKNKTCPSFSVPSIRTKEPAQVTFDSNDEARWEYEIQALDTSGSAYAKYDPQIIIVKAGEGFLGPGSLAGLLVVAVVGGLGLAVGFAAARYLARRSG